MVCLVFSAGRGESCELVTVLTLSACLGMSSTVMSLALLCLENLRNQDLAHVMSKVTLEAGLRLGLRCPESKFISSFCTVF